MLDWFYSTWKDRDQDKHIADLKDKVRRLRTEVNQDSPALWQLQRENAELELHLSLLVRLLISKKIITAEEFAELLLNNPPAGSSTP